MLLAGVWAAAERTEGQVTGREAQPKLVQFSAVAFDSGERPVGDLTADEIQIVDSGKPQKAAFFRHSDSKLQQAPPPEPGEFSNRAADNVPRATLILFDLLNESFETRGAAGNYLVQGLKTLETSDYLYLYILAADTRLYPVAGLPGSVTDSLPPDDVPWTKNAKSLLDGVIGKVYSLRPFTLDIDARVRATYRSLDSLANLLAGIPGRKNIVWVTHGVPIELGPAATVTDETVDYTSLLRTLSVVMDRANVAVYPVMQVTPGMAVPGTPEAQFSGLGSQETLQQIADLTGGPTRSANSIGEVVRHAMNDVRTSYQVGYYPPAENWDGKFHKLRITCRRKGVRIQAKTGYYAWLDQANDEQDALDAAVPPAFDASEIGLCGAISPGPAGAVRLSLRIDPADLRIVQQGDRYAGHVDVQVVGYSGNEASQRSPLAALDLTWSADELAAARKDGIRWNRDIQLLDSVNKVRLLVFDRESHAIGTLTMPVKPAK
jgi:VWFA-related protein